MTILSGKSQENCQICPELRSLVRGGVARFSSYISSCDPIGDTAGLAPCQSEWKRPYNSTMMKLARRSYAALTFPALFYLFKVLLQKYTLYEETPEDELIAKVLIEEYVQPGHNIKNIIVSSKLLKSPRSHVTQLVRNTVEQSMKDYNNLLCCYLNTMCWYTLMEKVTFNPRQYLLIQLTLIRMARGVYDPPKF